MGVYLFTLPERVLGFGRFGGTGLILRSQQ
jgi:hypothetical protein